MLPGFVVLIVKRRLPRPGKREAFSRKILEYVKIDFITGFLQLFCYLTGITYVTDKSHIQICRFAGKKISRRKDDEKMNTKIIKRMLGLSVTILLVLTGCGTESPNATEETTEVQGTEPVSALETTASIQQTEPAATIAETINIPLTLEYVCEEFDISAEEFTGVDFDAFVAFYGLTYENIQDEAVLFLLDNYKANGGETEYFDFSYLTDYDKEMIHMQENESEIVTVFSSQTVGDAHDFFVYDFENGKIFACAGAEHTVSGEDMTGTLADADKETITQLLDKYHVAEWTGNEVGEYDSEWYVAIEFADGIIYGVRGNCEYEAVDRVNGLLADLLALTE